MDKWEDKGKSHISTFAFLDIFMPLIFILNENGQSTFVWDLCTNTTNTMYLCVYLLYFST